MLGNYSFKRKGVKVAAGIMDGVGYGLKKVLGAHPPDLRPPEAYRRILLIRLDHLGDGLFLQPALRAARKIFPGARLTLLAGTGTGAFVKPGLWVDEVKIVDVPWFERPARRFDLNAFNKVQKWMSAQHFEVGIDFRGDFRHLLWMARAKIPVRMGYGGTGGGFLLTHENSIDLTRHEVESNLDLLRFFKPGLAADVFEPIEVSEKDKERADVILRQARISPERPLVLVQIKAGYPSKEWGLSKYEELFQRLISGDDLEIAVIGTQLEKEQVKPLLEKWRGRVLDLTGETRLGEMPGLLKRASVFVGPDSGPAHLAVVMGVPCILIYSGVNDLKRWGPWILGREDKVRVFRHPVFCSPCGLSVCPYHQECLEPIQPEQIHHSILELLNR